MRVYISADMEGVTGVTHSQDARVIFGAHNPPVHTGHTNTLTDALLSKASVNSSNLITL